MSDRGGSGLCIEVRAGKRDGFHALPPHVERRVMSATDRPFCPYCGESAADLVEEDRVTHRWFCAVCGRTFTPVAKENT